MIRNRTHSRVALAFVLIGGLLSLSGLSYLRYANRERTLPIPPRPLKPVPVMEAARDPGAEAVGRVAALYNSLTLTFVIFMIFLVGSFVLIRAGRFIRRVRSAPGPTVYVDAWSGYRMSAEEVAAALRRYEPDGESGEPPRATPDREPEEPPDAPRNG